ncbi:MAG TPA: hypothetical protein VK859_05135 [bacterium]|jgi:hypothetical protein|nr:hypothetical protein [bacterium]
MKCVNCGYSGYKCPECGHEKNLSAQKAWRAFEFTEENLLCFRLVLNKALMMEYSYRVGLDQMKAFPILENIPYDIACLFEFYGNMEQMALHSILECLHDKKICPSNAVHLKKTDVFKTIEKQRQFSAHIVPDKTRFIKTTKDSMTLNDTGLYAQIKTEVERFVVEGLDKYIETGSIFTKDLINTEVGLRYLIMVNEKRKKDGNVLIDLPDTKLDNGA